MQGFDWRSKQQQKRLEIYSQIPADWLLGQHEPDTTCSTREGRTITEEVEMALSQMELRITRMDVRSLLEQLRSGDLSSSEVVSAFCHRAANAHQFVSRPVDRIRRVL